MKSRLTDAFCSSVSAGCADSSAWFNASLAFAFACCCPIFTPLR